VKDMKRRLLELEGAWKALDDYAAHSAGCPTVWEADGACDCGLTATRARLRKAVLELLTHYALHDAGCPGLVGNKCDCGLDSARRRLEALARRRLQVLARRHPPDVTGNSLPPKE
jgi:hypothetical protein